MNRSPFFRRRLNAKFLVITLVSILLLGLGVHGLHAFQIRRNARVLLKQAAWAEEQGQADRTEKYLRMYLGYVPGDTEALIKYGDTLEQQTHSLAARLRAISTYEQVLLRDPRRSKIRRKLVSDAIELGRFGVATDHLKILLKAAPEDGDLEQLLGQCRENVADYPEAAGWYEKAIAHRPTLIESYRRLADVLRRRLDRPARADEVVDRLIAANGGAFEAYLVRGRYRKAFGLAGAAEDIEHARALAPDEADVLLATAELARDAGDANGARTILVRAEARYPKNHRVYQARSELELRAGGVEDVIACLTRGIAALPDRPDLRLSLADAQIRTGKLDEAGATIAALREKKLASELLDFLDARILVARKRWSDAARMLERVAPLLATAPDQAKHAHWLLGICQERLGNPDLELEAFRRAAGFDPRWVPARLGLAQALLAVGQEDDAIEEYRKLGPQVPEAQLALARVLVLKNLRLAPAQRRWADVDQILDEADRATPGTVAVMVLRAEVLAAQDKVDRAREVLTAARDKHPDQVELWTALATVAQRRGDPDGALRILDEARAKLGDSVELRLAHLRYWAGRRDAKARKAVADLATNVDRFPEDERFRLLEGLAEATLRVGDLAAARRLWDDLARQEPQRLRHQLHLFDLASQAGDPAAMGRAVREIHRIEGEGAILGDFAEAALRIERARRGDRSGLAEARNLLTKVASRRPGWGRAPLLEAEIAEIEGDQLAAIDAYLRAVAHGERPPQAVRRLVQLLYSRHRYAEADQAIRDHQKQAPIPGELTRLAAEISVRIQDPDRALALARQAVPTGSKDARDHVWMGQVLAASGKTADAEAELRQAVAMAEDAPETWVALVRFLSWSQRPAQAEAELEKARAKLPKDRAPLTLALCNEALGLRDRADEQYRAALAAKPGDPAILRCVANFKMSGGRFAAAEPYLRRMIEPDTKAPAAEVVWARRNLALGLAVGDELQFQEALKLVDRNLQAGGGMIEDQRTKVIILAMRPNYRRESIRTMLDLIGKQTPTPEEQFLLAQLYESDHDWPKARARLLALVTGDDKDPRHLAYYIRGLLRQGQADEAAVWLATLEEQDPKGLATLELKARILGAQGRGAESAALLNDFARTPKAPLAEVAGLLEELGRPADAEALYRTIAARPDPPTNRLVLALFLGRQGRVSEALDVCDAAAGSCPPAAVGAASLTILHSAKAEPEAYRRVERRLETAVREHPDQLPLQSYLATLQNLRGNYKEAEDVYRKLIERNGNDVMSLNNLAWLLAMKESKTAEALDLINRAITIAGRRSSLLDTRALVAMQMGRSDLAIIDLEEVVSRKPVPLNYFHLARAYLMAKDRAAATDAFRKAKAAGLKPGPIHPLEQTSYAQLAGELDREPARTGAGRTP